MSPDKEPITRDKLNEYLKDLAKEFRKLNGTKTPAEIILIGGAAVLANYGFRDMTYDVDAIIVASSAMKDAINHVGDRHGLPHGWLNADFKAHGLVLRQADRGFRILQDILKHSDHSHGRRRIPAGDETYERASVQKRLV